MDSQKIIEDIIHIIHILPYLGGRAIIDRTPIVEIDNTKLDVGLQRKSTSSDNLGDYIVKY